MDNAASSGKCSRQAGLDMLAGNRHVDVHGVPQRLVLVEILQPDRRTMAKRVDRVVVGQFGVTEHGAPEADIDGFGVRRDSELDFLRTAAIRDDPMLPCDRRDGSRQIDVPRLKPKDAARQPHRELVIGDRDEHTRAVDARHIGHRAGKPGSITE